jgi:ABC-type Fe3+-hydroxamate transport system substrate-binding protein
MGKQPLIALLGDSVLMDGVAFSLRDRQTLGVVRIGPSGHSIEESLKSLQPDLIVFELDSPLSQSILSLLKEQNGIPLLGLDLTCNRVVVLNSHHHIASTMSDLCRVVQEEAHWKKHS